MTTDPVAPDEIREAALRAVKWLKTSRAKAAPDAYNTILYLAARNHVLEQRLVQIDSVIHGPEMNALDSDDHLDDPRAQRTENGDTSPQGASDVAD